MEITFNLAVNVNAPQIVDALKLVAASILTSSEQEIDMAGELDALRQEVANNGSLINSATALIRGLADRISQNMNDPAALQQMVDDLRNQDAQLAQAVAENTPAENTGGGDTVSGGGGEDTSGGSSA